MFNGPFCPEVLYFGRAANGKPIIAVENATHSSIAGLLFLQRRGCTWSLFLQGAVRRRMCEFVGKMSRHLSGSAVSSGQAGSGVNFGPNVSLGNCNVQ